MGESRGATENGTAERAIPRERDAGDVILTARSWRGGAAKLTRVIAFFAAEQANGGAHDGIRLPRVRRVRRDVNGAPDASRRLVASDGNRASEQKRFFVVFLGR